MFTLVAFNEVPSAAAAFVNLKGAADQTVHVVGDVIYVPEKYNKLLWCCGTGFDVIRAKLESPSIRRIGVLMIEPKSNWDILPMRIFPVARLTLESPITLVPGEGLEAFIECNTDVTHIATIGVCLGDAIATPVRGEIWTVRATFAELTTEAYKWINTEITFDETLPVGRYQVVGASIYHYYGSLFRLVFIGQPNRPGGMTVGHQGGIEPNFQRLGNMGVWGEFHSSTPPSLDILGSEAGGSTGSIELDIIKIA